MWLKVIIGVVLIAHGIGHVLGLFPIAGWARAEHWSAESWALTSWTGPTITNVLGAALWLTAMVTFIVAGLGVLGLWVPIAWIRPLAVIGAVASIVGLVLFWEAFPENDEPDRCVGRRRHRAVGGAPRALAGGGHHPGLTHGTGVASARGWRDGVAI